MNSSKLLELVEMPLVLLLRIFQIVLAIILIGISASLVHDSYRDAFGYALFCVSCGTN